MALLLGLCAFSPSRPAHAQQPGVPGKFDFYLLDLPWGPEFCHIKDVSSQCKPQRGFVVHGLWPQNNDGTWPVFCSKETGPAGYEPYLRITPDLQLLQHEWDKHGTCSAQGATRFFQMEIEASRRITVPDEFRNAGNSGKDIVLTPEWILRSFYFENPNLPPGSLSLSCQDGRLTAVEACFDKDLHAIACKGLHSCQATALTLKNAPADAGLGIVRQ
jgi:ribonuclease T2